MPETTEEIAQEERDEKIVWVSFNKIDRAYIIDGVVYAPSDVGTETVPEKLAAHLGELAEQAPKQAALKPAATPRKAKKG